MRRTDSTADWAYEAWAGLLQRLDDRSSYQRSIAVLLLSNLAKSDTEGREFDMALGYAKPDMDPGVMDRYYSCWSADAGTSGDNYSGYCSPEMDVLVSRYWYTNDLEGRWVPLFEAQRILNQDRPFITLAAKNEIEAYRSDRFEFPSDTCHWAGFISPQGLMNVVVR